MAAQGEIIRIDVEYSAPAASQILNVFHWIIDVGNPADGTVVNHMEDWVTNEWGPDWQAIASVQATLDSVVVNVVNPDGTIARNLGSRVIGLAGLSGGEVSPAAVSGYMQLDTLLPRTKGKKYVPCISETKIDAGELNASAIADMVLLLAEYVTTYVVGASEYKPGVLRTGGAGFEGFRIGGLVESTPAYQRRRKRGVGA